MRDAIYPVGKLKPVEGHEAIFKIGDQASDFKLPNLQGKNVNLRKFRKRKNVVISFVSAAWTPICSGQ